MGLFQLFLRTSISASFLIAIIFTIRLFIKKLPSVYSYLLWLFVLFRLLCPVFLQIEGVESVSNYLTSLPYAAADERNYEAINQPKIINYPKGQTDGFQNEAEEPVLASCQLLNQKNINLNTIWRSGIVLIGFLSIMQTIAIYRRVKNSERLYDNIFLSNNITSPFVLGLLRPNIYLPSDIRDSTYIIAHEKVHVKRKDNIIKILFWVAAIFHWYNPIVWLALKAMENDMEMSCDECVIQNFGEDIRIDYSSQLIKIASGRNSAILPVQFNKGSTMRRFKNIFQRKNTPNGIEKAAIFAIALSLTICCMVTGKAAQDTWPAAAGITKEQTQITNQVSKGKTSAPAAAWAMNTMLDTEIPDLDYASDDRVIFHGYFGLFVYDLQSKQLTRSLNLKDLGCQKVQTGGPCRVLVSEDGELVYLYPYEKEYMYTFNISENSIEKTDATVPVAYFKGLLKLRDVMTKGEAKIQFGSTNAVSFHDGSYGYLYLNGGYLSDIVYQRGGKTQQLLTEKDTLSPALLCQDDSFYQAYQIKSNESYEGFIYSYQTMYSLNDYRGICSLSKDLNYSDEMQKQWKEYNHSIAWGEELKSTGNRSCYKFIIDHNNSSEGIQEEKYLYMKKDEAGWYADGLPKNNPPDEIWWLN